MAVECVIVGCEYCGSLGAREFFYTLEEEESYFNVVSEGDVGKLIGFASEAFKGDSKALRYGLLDNVNTDSNVLKELLVNSSSLDVLCRFSIALHDAADLVLLDLVLFDGEGGYSLDVFHRDLCLSLLVSRENIPVDVLEKVYGLNIFEVNQLLKFNDSVPDCFKK